MDLKSVSGLTFFVKDLAVTADFYEKLGFRIGSQDDMQVTVYLNWFSMKFCATPKDNPEFTQEAQAAHKGAGLYVNIKVADVDEFYEVVRALGCKPSSQPRDWPWGQREFVLRDPDDYKLVFFQKK